MLLTAVGSSHIVTACGILHVYFIETNHIYCFQRYNKFKFRMNYTTAKMDYSKGMPVCSECVRQRIKGKEICDQCQELRHQRRQPFSLSYKNYSSADTCSKEAHNSSVRVESIGASSLKHSSVSHDYENSLNKTFTCNDRSNDAFSKFDDINFGQNQVQSASCNKNAIHTDFSTKDAYALDKIRYNNKKAKSEFSKGTKTINNDTSDLSKSSFYFDHSSQEKGHFKHPENTSSREQCKRLRDRSKASSQKSCRKVFNSHNNHDNNVHIDDKHSRKGHSSSGHEAICELGDTHQFERRHARNVSKGYLKENNEKALEDKNLSCSSRSNTNMHRALANKDTQLPLVNLKMCAYKRSSLVNKHKDETKTPNHQTGLFATRHKALVIGVVIFIGSTIIGAGVLVYLGQNGLLIQGNEFIVMINAHVQMRIINRNYTSAMKNKSGEEFGNLSHHFCNEIDVRFRSGVLTTAYHQCEVQSFWSGSLLVYFISPFTETSQTSNVSLIREVLAKQSFAHETLGDINNVTWFGDFLVDINSIEIRLERFKWGNRPIQIDGPSFMYMDITTASTEQYGLSSQIIMSATNSKDPDANISTNSLELLAVLSSLHTSILLQNQNMSNFTDTTNGENQQPSTSKSVVVSQKNATALRKLTVNHSANYIRVTNRTSMINETSEIGCKVFLLNVSSMTIYHKAPNKHETVFKHLTVNEMVTKLAKGKLLSVADNIKLEIQKEQHSTNFLIHFVPVTCSDVGAYRFQIAASNDQNEYSETGFLFVKEHPGKPMLTMPEDMIEHQELHTTPITCTANVGIPPGKIVWNIKPKGYDSFLNFDGNIVNKSDTCENVVTSALFYTPTLDGNGTVLLCSVFNKHFHPLTNLSAAVELQILPGNLCKGVVEGSLIRHPFTCSKYIECSKEGYKVRQCVNNMCFDEKKGKCGQIALMMSSGVAFVNERVTSLQCRLTHLGVWHNITISRALNFGKKLPIITARYGVEDVYIHDSIMKERVHGSVDSSKSYVVDLILWIYVPTCEDEEEYLCNVDANLTLETSKGRLMLKAKPGAPTLHVPSNLIEHSPMRQNITCEANLGYPGGSLFLKMRFPDETDFRTIQYNVSSVTENLQCSTSTKMSFNFIPSLDHNGLEILCEVTNNETLPDSYKMAAVEKVYVIPANYCNHTADDVTKIHPYDCHQYVQCVKGYTYVQKCGSDLCFNPDTQMCDKEVERNATQFEPLRPCKTSHDGIFYPHPFVCNKYIWCIQGKEIMQHCPLGTLYIDNGQCTFEPDQSRCYKNSGK